jgi:hypothetical protein
MSETTTTVNGVDIRLSVYNCHEDVSASMMEESISRYVTSIYGQDVEEDGEEALEEFYELIKWVSSESDPEVGEKMIEMAREQIAKYPKFDYIGVYAVSEWYQRYHPSYIIAFWTG